MEESDVDVPEDGLTVRMPASERYYAHLSACVICQRQQAPTGSGRCAYGFRSFLDFSAEVWRRLKELQAKSA